MADVESTPQPENGAAPPEQGGSPRTQTSTTRAGEGASEFSARDGGGADTTITSDIPHDDDEEGDEEDGAGTGMDAAAEQEMMLGIASNDVKNIILQVVSPYFDDDGTADAGTTDEEEDTAQRYDHVKSHMWIQLICDGVLERLMAMAKPYKFVVHCMIMRKCGAGMHVCSSCYYGQSDGWVSHAHDLSAHIYAVITVYWSAI